MKIQLLRSNVAVQCVVLPNLLVFPNFLVSKFCCCQGKASVNFSMKTNFQFAQFGSIAGRGVLVALIWSNFQFCGGHYCEDTALSDECKWINPPFRTKLVRFC